MPDDPSERRNSVQNTGGFCCWSRGFALGLFAPTRLVVCAGQKSGRPVPSPPKKALAYNGLFPHTFKSRMLNEFTERGRYPVRDAPVQKFISIFKRPAFPEIIRITPFPAVN